MDFGYKEFKFKHLKNIKAVISYDWSKHALILGKNRTVICSVPREDIEQSKSWELIKH